MPRQSEHSVPRAFLRILLMCLLLLSHGGIADGAGNPFGARGIRFAYSSSLIPELSRADALTALELFTREFTRFAGYDVATRLTLYDDLAEYVAAIRDGEVDFIAMRPLEYLKIRGLVSIELALLGEKEGKPGEEQVLLVRRDSGIRSLEQLRGKKLAILQGGGGEIASLWLDSLLADRRLPPAGRLFGAMKTAPKAQQAILPVFFGQADACIVGNNAFRMAAELNPQVGRDLVALATSPVYPVAITCFRTGLTKEQKDEFVRMAFRLKDSPSGKQIYTLYKVDNIVPGSDRVLDPLASLVKASGPGKPVSRRAPK